MANIIEAAGAYANTMKQARQSDASEGAAGGASFGDTLKGLAQGAIDAQHHSEKVSAGALMGQYGMTEVLQAIDDADMKLKTVLAIRDRLVQAYDRIMNTPV